MTGKRVLTWHVHGNYLFYLSHMDHEIYLPTSDRRGHGYSGRSGTFPWPSNVHEVPVEAVPDLELDAVIYQSEWNWRVDRQEILGAPQRRLPQVVIEHDPPRSTPTDTRHHVDDPDVLVVHVTHFNQLMWDNHGVPSIVIEHGVVVPDDVAYDGELERGIVVVNNLRRRGRRLGADVFEDLRRQVPLDLVGMGSAVLGGLGEIGPEQLTRVESRYRFFCNPIRYTSLGLAVCEAMMVGLPIVGLATTEMVSTIENGVSGFVRTDPRALVDDMQMLLRDRDAARRLGEGARATALERFSIERFARDWTGAIDAMVDHGARSTARDWQRTGGTPDRQHAAIAHDWHRSPATL